MTARVEGAGPVMAGIEGPGLSQEERELLRHPAVGGVILFSRNYESGEQLRALTADIHALRDPPLLIAIDQEGGRVQRLREGFTALPPLATFGRLHDRAPAQALAAAETAGWLMAAEMLEAGIDLSFAPVLDLDTGVSGVIGDRAFHADPAVVAALGAAYVRGMRRAGMPATGKHFPGHGSVSADSHHALPVDPRPFEQIEAMDLVPFERLARDGGIDAMMAAHVLYSAVDERLAGFSRYWIRDVLRGRCGFEGAVFSDDLLMAAARAAGDVAESALVALDAGCDMVLVCRGTEEVARAVEAVGAPRAGSARRIGRLRPRRRPRAGLRTTARWRRAVDSLRETT